MESNAAREYICYKHGAPMELNAAIDNVFVGNHVI